MPELKRLNFHHSAEQTLQLRCLFSEAPASQPAPLLVFLHGASERGDNLDELSRQGLPQILAAQRRHNFHVLAPQCPANSSWCLEFRALSQLLVECTENFKVDPTRVYLLGLSMGAGAAWYWAWREPKRFAAMALCCGRAPWWAGFPERAAELKDLPVWLFHGAKDQIIPLKASQQLADAHRSNGGAAHLTVYHDVGHECWSRALDEASLWEWLLSHKSP
jgi:predicted peptidase